MDPDVQTGWVFGVVVIGAIAWIPIADIRRHGLRACLRGWLAKPFNSIGSILGFAGLASCLLWMLSGGRWPIALGLLFVPGLILIIVDHGRTR